MGTRAMISDLKSESHLHLATIERHGHHIKIVSTKAYIHDKLVHSCIINHFHSLLMRACNYCWVWGGGRRHPIYYIFISHNFGCKWVKYSILWCQPCQNSFIWTYFPIAYTNKTKLSVLNHFLNMTDFDNIFNTFII